MLTRFVRIQLIIFTIASIVGMSVMAVGYLQAHHFFGIGRINVALELPATGGLYRLSNVTYRGKQVGEVTGIELAKNGVTATMALDTSTRIPADLDAYVLSVSAIGEQYVDLRPRTDAPPYLREGSVIREEQTAMPQPVGPMLDELSAFVGSIPKKQLDHLLGESFQAFNGAEYDLQSLLDSTSKLTTDISPLAGRVRTLIEDTRPLLFSQSRSADAIRIWTRSLAGVTDQLVINDPQVRTILNIGPGFAQEATRLLDQLKVTVPILLANMQTVGQLLVTYNPGLEQALVLLPPMVSTLSVAHPTRNAAGLGQGNFLLGSNSDPPPCSVGFLPPSEWRSPADTTTKDLPDGIYCKLPQDSPTSVRGVRNIPCMTKPWKRAPTAEICNSDQEYEPIAKKQPPIGPLPRDPSLEAQGVTPDPRWFPDAGLYAPVGEGPPAPDGMTPGPIPGAATPDESGPQIPVLPNVQPDHSSSVPPFSGSIPPPPAPPPPGVGPPPPPHGQTPPSVHGPELPGGVVPPPGAPPAEPSSFGATDSASEPSLGVARYNPRTGEYVGPDGALYRQSDLVRPAVPKTWKDLVFSS